MWELSFQYHVLNFSKLRGVMELIISVFYLNLASPKLLRLGKTQTSLAFLSTFRNFATPWRSYSVSA